MNMNAYYKETEKPYGYLLVDNKPGTPPDNQILADLFGECYAYHFGVNSTEPTRVETKPVGKHSTTTKITFSRKKPVQTVTWSNATIPEWQEYTLGATHRVIVDLHLRTYTCLYSVMQMCIR